MKDTLAPVPWDFLALPEAGIPARTIAHCSGAAFLGFRLAVEDDFIWYSRHPLDLWSGSGLVSWLTAQVLQALVERLGQDCLLFPAASQWASATALKQELLRGPLCPSPAHGSGQNHPDASLASPGLQYSYSGLSSYILAMVPVDFQAQPLLDAVQAEWKRISRLCWTWLGVRYPLDATQGVLWESQTKRALRFVWQVWPWQDLNHASALLRKIGADPLLDGPRSDAAGLWQANLTLLNHRFVSRQKTCDFASWEGQAGVNKDQVNRAYEAILDPVCSTPNGKHQAAAQSSPELLRLFQPQERLGALNIIKRVWPRAVLGAKDEAIAATSSAQQELMSLLVWTGNTAPLNFDAPSVPKRITEHHGWLLRSVPGQGVAWLPSGEVLACAQALQADFTAASSATINMAVAIPVGATSFARLLQTAGETTRNDDLSRETSAGQDAHLWIRLVSASRRQAEWRASFNNPALAWLSKAGYLSGIALDTNEAEAWCGQIKKIMCRLESYPQQQLITPSLAAILLADLESVGEATPAALEVRLACRAYLTPPTGSRPQLLSEFWNWLLLARFFVGARTRTEPSGFTA
jgi:hypothetical protein